MLRLAFAFDDNGRLPYDTVIWSCPKKSGKTTLNAALTLWWGFTQESPNELLCVANDLEQSLARVYRTMENLIEFNPHLRAEAEVQSKTIYLQNGSIITAISSDYQGAAGSNHGWVSYEEIWAVSSESGRRLFEELTASPARKNSVKFIATYAGWHGESELLWDLYLKGVSQEEHSGGQGSRIHPALPIYHNREARLFVYWDKTPRMPWLTEEYYESQRRTLRPASFQRLHGNEWVSSEARFIEPECYDSCVENWLSEDLTGDLFVGVDVGLKSDSTAAVCVKFDDRSDKLVVGGHRIWLPRPGEVLDLGSTLEFFIRGLSQRARIVKLVYDPSQAQRSMQMIREMWIDTEELAQTQNNLSAATQTLYDFLVNRKLRIYPSQDLREHVLNASTKETERVFRLTKERQTRKIDAAVALSFACLAAVQHGRPASVVNSPLPTIKSNLVFDVLRVRGRY